MIPRISAAVTRDRQMSLPGKERRLTSSRRVRRGSRRASKAVVAVRFSPQAHGRTASWSLTRLCRLCSTRVNTSNAHGGRGDELTAEKAPWDHRVPTSDAWSKKVWRPCLFTANECLEADLV